MSLSAPAISETEDNVLRIGLSRMTVSQLKHRCQGRISNIWLLRKDEILHEMMKQFPLQELRDIASTVSPTSIIGRKRGAAEEVLGVDGRLVKRLATLPDCYVHEDPDLREFMALPSNNEYRSCIQGVRDRTSRAALQSAICMVCAREVFERETDWIGVDKIPHPTRLIPVDPNPHWQLTHGLGLHRPAIKGERNAECGALCRECRASLDRDRLPWCALANNLWIGDVPFELAVLTRPEELLISLYFPTAFIYKLYPKSKQFDPESLQMGYRGNVSTYRLDTSEIASFIGSKTLPHRSELLASTIAVTFVGPWNRPERSMQGLFRVRRHRVLAALVWLKEHNPLYLNVEIDHEALESLPDGGIPSSILTNVRFDPDGSRADNDTGYIPHVGDDDDDEEYAVEEDVHTTNEAAQSTSEDDDAPEIIPLQQMGVVDNDVTTIDSATLLRSAIANLSEAERDEGIAVRRGNEFISEWPRRDPITNQLTAGSSDNPNHLLGAFPCLFPYAAGGFEVERPHPVSYHQHGGWCLDYPDRRFRRNPAFIAQVFGVLHKRQVCSSASVQVRRPAYERCEEAISQLTVSDIQRIFSKEASPEPPNPAIAMLKKQIYATSARVMGSDASRKSIRRRIYGLMAFLSPPTVWCTINLCDIDDPVAQVFSGDEDIDMDAFDPRLGPDSKTRAHRIADDPYAAAKFFHHMVKVLLEELFGIQVTPMQGLLRRKGVLGRINAYVGAVESQGRGTLHLHILFWLCGAPTGQKMKALLKSDEFRELLKQFIAQNIRAHLDGIDETLYHTKTNLKSHVAWARPPDPFNEDACKKREFEIASVSQKHDCGPGCRKTFKGHVLCKRRAPFELAETDFVTEFGEWGPKRTFAWLNAWCPPLTLCTGANNDMKLLLCGAAVIALAFYVTEYVTKKQVKSVNAGALISRRLAYHMQEEAMTQDIRERNRRLIYKCLNTLAREHELSGPELVSYIKGWGDRYYSHTFVAIIWSSMLYMLKREFPELRSSISGEQSTQSNNKDGENGWDEHETDVRLQSFGDNRLGERSQLQDYYLRAQGFAEWGLLFYLLQTWEVKREEDDLNTVSHGNRAERHFYQDSHPRSKTHARIVRKQNHEVIPEFIGPWFPRRDNPSTRKLYCASMLLLFKPWTELHELKGESFEALFEEYTKGCSQRERDIMDNIQWYYETADAVEEDRKRNADSAMAAAFEDGVYDDPEIEAEAEVAGVHPTLQAEGVMLEESTLENHHGCSLAEWKNGEQAVIIGEKCGILGNPETWFSTPSPHFGVVGKEDTMLWEEAVDRLTEMGLDHEVKNDEEIWVPRAVPPSIVIRNPAETLHGPMIDQLSSDQRRAVEILDDHLCDTLLGKNPPQLLMLVMGEGGTGKSKVIEAVSWVFEQRGLSHLLAKVGSTNVAANLIGGTTLHHLMVLPVGNLVTQRAPSELTKQKREARLRSKRYLLGDEISMLTEEQMAVSSDVTGTAHAGLEGASGLLPFGGLLNVVFFGDYHQFPPVQHSATALYKRNPPNTYAAIGRGIMEQFNTVVLLKEQKRMAAGSEWAKTLSRARYGACNEEDISMMKSLILTNSSCNALGFDKSTTVLVTPRNAVRIQWNQRAVRKWCMEKKKPLFIIHARDEIGKTKRPPNTAELHAIAECREDKTGELVSTLELAEGMPIMVTFRHKTEKSLSKGASGVVKHIIISDKDAATDQTHGIVELQDLPKAIILKLDHPPQSAIAGFQLGEIPVVPYTHRFRIQPFRTDKSSSITVTRHQYGLVPAFAFTDYKAQGQTLNHVVVDIGQPARGHISQFNAYVAVSRGRGPESLRFLRDFDTRLFTSGTDEDLAAEDARLEALNHQTTKRFEARHSGHVLS